MLSVGEVVVVKFPEDKPLCGWEEELRMRVGDTIEVEKIDEHPLTRSEFMLEITEQTDGQRVLEGLMDFVNRHPDTVFTSSGNIIIKAS